MGAYVVMLLCGYWHVQILQHIINPVPQSDGMYPAVCAVRIFSLCCLSGMLPFLSA